jgi:diguanylate cyclase (GGDEF)-like protein
MEVFWSIGCPVALLDTAGTIVANNPRWQQEVGERGLVGTRYQASLRSPGAGDLDLVLEEGIDEVLAHKRDRFELEHPEEGEFGRHWNLIIATPVAGGAVLVLIDVTTHHDVHDILDARAHRDALTGLPNRLAITQRLAAVVERAHRQTTRASIVFLDLDGFKSVNDRLGHDVGDEVLAAVGRRLVGTIRSEDLLGRWGGDEFVVIMDGGDVQAVQSLASRLHAALAEPVAISRHRTVDLGISVGASSVFPGDTPDDVLARADRAMFEAKRSGTDLVLAPGTTDEVEG